VRINDNLDLMDTEKAEVTTQRSSNSIPEQPKVNKVKIKSHLKCRGLLLILSLKPSFYCEPIMFWILVLRMVGGSRCDVFVHDVTGCMIPASDQSTRRDSLIVVLPVLVFLSVCLLLFLVQFVVGHVFLILPSSCMPLPCSTFTARM
jgi:hypothetical protein